MTPWGSLRVVLTYRCNRKCDYCYARGLVKRFPHDMSKLDFGMLLSWLKKNNPRYVSEPGTLKGLKRFGLRVLDRLTNKPPTIIFLGGEPTIHPEFVEFSDMCVENGFRASVLTNGLFGEKVRESVSRRRFYYFMVNVNPPSEYSEKEWALLEKNLGKIRDEKVELWIRYNIPSTDTPMDYVVELAKRFGARGIRYGTTNPGFSPETSYVAPEKISLFGEKVKRFVGLCKENGLLCNLARPLPMCAFGEEDWRWLVKNAGFKAKCFVGRGGDYAYRIIVNPDLSTFVCFSVFMHGPSILGHENLASVSDYYKEKFEKLRWTPLMERCKTCKHFLDKECQGGCLSYKCSSKESVC